MAYGWLCVVLLSYFLQKPLFPRIETNLFYQTERGRKRIGCHCLDVQLLYSWTSAWLQTARSLLSSVSLHCPTGSYLYHTISNHDHTPTTDCQQKHNWRDWLANRGKAGHLVDPVDPVSSESTLASLFITFSDGISSFKKCISVV